MKRLTRLLLPLILMGLTAWAEAPLKDALGLTIDQARQVQEIQAQHRPKFAAKRQERNRELRVLRRAKLANDSTQIARQEKITDKLTEELKQIQMHEDAEIRRLLTPEQNRKFDDYLKLRKEMVGSSREGF